MCVAAVFQEHTRRRKYMSVPTRTGAQSHARRSVHAAAPALSCSERLIETAVVVVVPVPSGRVGCHQVSRWLESEARVSIAPTILEGHSRLALYISIEYIRPGWIRSPCITGRLQRPHALCLCAGPRGCCPQKSAGAAAFTPRPAPPAPGRVAPGCGECNRGACRLGTAACRAPRPPAA